MAFGPARQVRDQPFISGGGFGMAAAIAEQPGAAMRDVAIVGGDCEGAAAAFERLLAAPGMEQRLGGAAIQRRGGCAAALVQPEIADTCVELSGPQQGRE